MRSGITPAAPSPSAKPKRVRACRRRARLSLPNSMNSSNEMVGMSAGIVATRVRYVVIRCKRTEGGRTEGRRSAEGGAASRFAAAASARQVPPQRPTAYAQPEDARRALGQAALMSDRAKSLGSSFPLR